MTDHLVLRDAEFDPKVKLYWMINSTMLCILTIVGIPLLPVVWIVGAGLIQRYLDRMACTLTERTLELRKGLLNRTESTIPLEKITDLQMYQGPIMRHLGLYGFKVETAGQTGAGGALLSIVGIVDAPGFRQAVLEQRDRVGGTGASGGGGGGAGAAPSAATAGAAVPAETIELLRDLRDTVARIERQLDDRG